MPMVPPSPWPPNDGLTKSVPWMSPPMPSALTVSAPLMSMRPPSLDEILTLPPVPSPPVRSPLPILASPLALTSTVNACSRIWPLLNVWIPTLPPRLSRLSPSTLGKKAPTLAKICVPSATDKVLPLLARMSTLVAVPSCAGPALSRKLLLNVMSPPSAPMSTNEEKSELMVEAVKSPATVRLLPPLALTVMLPFAAAFWLCRLTLPPKSIEPSSASTWMLPLTELSTCPR